MITKFKTMALLTLMTLMLAACSGPFSDHSNYDLKSLYSKCDFNRLTAAGAQRCNNIKKECDKRQEDTGFRC